jgi:hypothetical protein
MAIVIVVHTPLQQKQAHFHYSLKLSKSLNGKQQNSFSTTNSLTNFATNTSHNLKLPRGLIIK